MADEYLQLSSETQIAPRLTDLHRWQRSSCRLSSRAQWKQADRRAGKASRRCLQGWSGSRATSPKRCVQTAFYHTTFQAHVSTITTRGKESILTSSGRRTTVCSAPLSYKWLQVALWPVQIRRMVCAAASGSQSKICHPAALVMSEMLVLVPFWKRKSVNS